MKRTQALESSNITLKQGLMLLPLTAKSSRGTLSPAFHSVQNLSDKDKTLAFSITSRQRLNIPSEVVFLILAEAAEL